MAQVDKTVIELCRKNGFMFFSSNQMVNPVFCKQCENNILREAAIRLVCGCLVHDHCVFDLINENINCPFCFKSMTKNLEYHTDSIEEVCHKYNFKRLYKTKLTQCDYCPNLINNETVVELTCGHIYHEECLHLEVVDFENDKCTKCQKPFIDSSTKDYSVEAKELCKKYEFIFFQNAEASCCFCNAMIARDDCIQTSCRHFYHCKCIYDYVTILRSTFCIKCYRPFVIKSDITYNSNIVNQNDVSNITNSSNLVNQNNMKSEDQENLNSMIIDNKMIEMEILLGWKYGFQFHEIYDKEITCNICLDCTKGNLTTELLCGHVYHYECIMTAILIHKCKTCPDCKQIFEIIKNNSEHEHYNSYYDDYEYGYSSKYDYRNHYNWHY